MTTFGTNRKPVCNFLLVTNSGLHPISRRLQDIADYWSNFRCRRESASLSCTCLGWTHQYSIAKFGLKKLKTMVWCRAYFDTLSWTVQAWLRSVTDRRTDRHYCSKCRASLRCTANEMHTCKAQNNQIMQPQEPSYCWDGRPCSVSQVELSLWSVQPKTRFCGLYSRTVWV